MRRLIVLTTLACALTALAESSSTPPRLPGKVAIEQRMGTKVPMDLMFRDETGQIVRLGKLFRGKAVLLNFMYYRCPMLCSLVVEGETSALTELKFDVGKEFDVLSVSIDPRDMPEAAAAQKEKYLRRYGRFGSSAGWHFLTGHESSIRQLADSVGFQYAYDPKIDQFAHGATLIVLTPDGRISRYLYGFEHKARDLKFALMDASASRIGSVSDAILLLCYHYDPGTGRYSRSAMNVVRAGGFATVASIAGFIFVMIWRERKNGVPNP
jgi:protein SCO1/2